MPTRTTIPKTIRPRTPPPIRPLPQNKTLHQDHYLYGGEWSWWGVVWICRGGGGAALEICSLLTLFWSILIQNRGGGKTQSYSIKIWGGGAGVVPAPLNPCQGIARGPPVVGTALRWLHSLRLPLLFTIIFHHSDWAGYNPGWNRHWYSLPKLFKNLTSQIELVFFPCKISLQICLAVNMRVSSLSESVRLMNTPPVYSVPLLKCGSIPKRARGGGGGREECPTLFSAMWMQITCSQIHQGQPTFCDSPNLWVLSYEFDHQAPTIILSMHLLQQFKANV